MQLSRRPCARQDAAAAAIERRPAIRFRTWFSWLHRAGPRTLDARGHRPRPAGCARCAQCEKPPESAGFDATLHRPQPARRTPILERMRYDGDRGPLAHRVERPRLEFRLRPPPVAKPGEAAQPPHHATRFRRRSRGGSTARPAATAVEPAHAGRGRQRSVRAPPSRSRVASRASRTPRRRGR